MRLPLLLLLWEYTALHAAAEANDALQVHSLLMAGLDKNAPDFWSDTPLHLAAKKDNVAAAQVLIGEGGAPTDPRTWLNETPLHLAAERGNIDVALFLLASGANKEAKTCFPGFGATPLHRCYIGLSLKWRDRS
ncbi:ankyrin repeat-containing domain protein [Baffinella frigidus]|nr:ankyrin repeat-containing domain protein [Cryptophyta sp. CCMP2293]